MRHSRAQVKMSSVVEHLSQLPTRSKIKLRTKSRTSQAYKIIKEWSAKGEKKESIEKKCNKKLNKKDKKEKILESK